MKEIKTAILRLFKPNATDENWDYFGKKCPYFGVVTWEQNRPENFDEKARQDFFQTGQTYTEWIMGFIRKNIDAHFRPKKSLDFGCGVGRLLIPIAQQSASATGVEISPSMMAEAKANCDRAGLKDVRFVKTVDDLGRDQFDFINSFIVFQHIPPVRGYEIFRQLVSLLQENGVGAVHFTYHDSGRRRDRYLNKAYRKAPFLFAIKNALTKQPLLEPRMEMAEYSLNMLFRILHESGCHVIHTVHTKHGVTGVIMIFQKKQISPL